MSERLPLPLEMVAGAIGGVPIRPYGEDLSNLLKRLPAESGIGHWSTSAPGEPSVGCRVAASVRRHSHGDTSSDSWQGQLRVRRNTVQVNGWMIPPGVRCSSRSARSRSKADANNPARSSAS